MPIWNEKNVLHYLSDLSPEHFVQTVELSMRRMPEEKKFEVFTLFSERHKELSIRMMKHQKELENRLLGLDVDNPPRRERS